jgi:prepilin-type processing-associated H-X9-DG protein
MNTRAWTARAFTIIELLAIIIVISLLSAMVLPALARTKASTRRVNCSDNLKRVGLGFQTWAASHSDLYPMRVPLSSGGYSDFLGARTLTTSQSSSRGVFGFFLVMSNELGTPHILICPAESDPRTGATTFSGTSTGQVSLTNDLNVSYFVGVDTLTTSSRMLLSGDHNMGADGNVVPHIGFVTYPTGYSPDFKLSLGTNFTLNSGVGWLNSMHAKQGNALMGDGSVQQLDRDHLQQTLQNSGDSGVSVGVAWKVPVGCSGPGINRVQFP